MIPLRIGYLPLADAALLFVAAEKGFDRAHGVAFELIRDVSWANARDKLAVGAFDAAHMLAPAALASNLVSDGFGGPLIAAAGLGLGGAAISVSPALRAAILGELEGPEADPAATARALARVTARRRADGAPPLVFAHVFPYSLHHYYLRLWLRLGGVSSERARLTVAPPPLMASSIAKGFMDGFCAGEPWGAQAERVGAARRLHSGGDLLMNCPDKVLAFRRDGARAHCARAAGRAVAAAAVWAEDEANRDEFSRIAARAFDGAAPAELMLPLLQSQGVASCLRFDRRSIGLNLAQMAFLFGLMGFAGQMDFPREAMDRAARAFLAEAEDYEAQTPALRRGPVFSFPDVEAFARKLTLGPWDRD